MEEGVSMSRLEGCRDSNGEDCSESCREGCSEGSIDMSGEMLGVFVGLFDFFHNVMVGFASLSFWTTCRKSLPVMAMLGRSCGHGWYTASKYRTISGFGKK
jgi:hypothetical protein